MRTVQKMFVDLGVSGKIDIPELKDYTAWCSPEGIFPKF